MKVRVNNPCETDHETTCDQIGNRVAGLYMMMFLSAMKGRRGFNSSARSRKS